MSENLLTLTIDGHEVKASADSSIIQAYARSGSAITANVGCMGQGVCGSCRCMIRKEGEREVTTALACETKVEEGMQVSFLDYFIPEHIQYYDVSEVGDGWNWLDDTAKAFPEAQHCRHCGGCNRACPKGLEVENGVAQVVSGDFGAFYGAGLALGAPPMLFALVMAAATGIMMSLTHYATGSAPVIYDSNYVNMTEWWKAGFIMSVVEILIFSTVGILWWKVLGYW